MARGLPAEISSMQMDKEAVPLDGNGVSRVRRKGRGWSELRKRTGGLKPGAYMRSGVEAERR